MQANWLFMALAAALSLGALGVVLSPLLRGAGRAERRASYDMQVYRDQLRTIEADVARGALGAGEAAAIRLEISRRLLAAADAETVEAAPTPAPRRVSLAAGGLLGLAALAIALGLYERLGVPGLPDAPLGARLSDLAAARADRPGQAEAEALTAAQAPQEPPQAPAAGPSGDMALVERLRAVVAERPDDLQGQRLLARSEAALGRWSAARAAQQRAVELMGGAAQAPDLIDLAEFMILATGGYVSPEAEALLSRALAAAPGDPAARYYSGLALFQGGRADLAYDLWSRLLEEGPEDAPWIAPIRAQMPTVAALAGRPEPTGGGPSAAQVEAAQGMSEGDRAAMISGMVEQLSDRLAAEGGPPEDWARLIRSMAVLGRTDEARAIWREARDVFAADPAAIGLLRETAASAGVRE